MKQDTIPEQTLPTEWACYLCEEVCHNARNKWFSLARLMCWHCEREAHGDRAHMGFIRSAGNRGCPWVNARAKHYYWAFHKPSDN